MERRTLLGAAGLAALAGVLPRAGQAQDAPQYTIALIPGLTTDAFYITMNRGAQAAADALGVELIFQGAPNFNPVEQVKKFQLLPAEWTIEGGELTHTLKLRRKQILQKYQHLLMRLYSDA